MNRQNINPMQGESSRDSPMMVIVGSPNIKGEKIQEHKEDETVVRIHQLERTGQVSWDPNDHG